MSTAAKPLNLAASSPAKPFGGSTQTPVTETSAVAPANQANASDITSPHELVAFVERLLETLDSKFDEMSSQILGRMNQMSSRVDALEASIQDIINGDFGAGASVPQSPSLGSAGLVGVRRNGST